MSANPEEAIKDQIQEMITFENETSSQIIMFLKTIGPFLKQIQDCESQTADGFIKLHSLFETIRDFERDVLNIQKPTIDSFADLITKRNFQKEFQELNEKMPPSSDLQKFLMQKSQSAFHKALKNAKQPEVYWFHLPYQYAQKWEKFWEFILSVLPPECITRGIYQKCRNEFKAADHQQIYRRNAETNKKQLAMLKQYGKTSNLDFDDSLRLHACVKGNVVEGSLSNIMFKPAYLFFFEDRIAIMRTSEKTVQQQSILNIWIVHSAMFPKAKRILDVLGTDFSFAFQPENQTASDNLWKAWSVLMSEKPRDYGIFQPIMLNDAPPPALDWVEINE